MTSFEKFWKFFFHFILTIWAFLTVFTKKIFFPSDVTWSDGQMAKVIRKWRHLRSDRHLKKVTSLLSSDEQMARANVTIFDKLHYGLERMNTNIYAEVPQNSRFYLWSFSHWLQTYQNLHFVGNVSSINHRRQICWFQNGKYLLYSFDQNRS